MIADLKALKAFMGKSTDADPELDPLMSAALEASIAQVQERCGRTFEIPTEETVDETRIFTAAAVTYIDDVVSITTLRSSTDNATWSTVSNTWLEPFNTYPKYRIVGQAMCGYVEVTGIFGYGPVDSVVPAPVKTATLMMAQQLYLRKDTPTGVAFGGEFGVVRVSRFEDPHVERLLGPYVRGDRMGIA